MPSPTSTRASTSENRNSGTAIDGGLLRWRGVGLPLLASLALHTFLLGLLAVVAYRIVVPSAEPPPTTRDVFLSLQPTSTPVAAPVPAPSSSTASTAPSPAEAPAPVAGGLIDTSLPVFNPPPAGPPAASSGASVSSALSASGPAVSFAGLSAGGRRAKSVVYVVDASGPMVTTLPDVLSEVQRSVDGLAPTQRFGVVLFADQTHETNSSTGGEDTSRLSKQFEGKLVDASPRYRARLAEWMARVVPRGRSNPLDGVRAGLALRPQVLFLLTRSINRSAGGAWDLGLDTIMAELDRLNPVDPATGQRPVIIKTIQFIEPDPTGIMVRIAEVHGTGHLEQDYRVLTPQELRAR